MSSKILEYLVGAVLIIAALCAAYQLVLRPAITDTANKTAETIINAGGRHDRR